MKNIEKYYWDRRPGCFVDKQGQSMAGPSFTGNTVEWYLTLLETIRDAIEENDEEYNVLLTGPDIHTILQCLVQYRPLLDFDKPEYICENCGFEKEKNEQKLNYKDVLFTKQGSLMKHITIYENKSIFFPRNQIILLNKDLKDPIVIEVKGISIFE